MQEDAIAWEPISKTIARDMSAGDAKDSKKFNALFARDALHDFDGRSSWPGIWHECIDEIQARSAAWWPAFVPRQILEMQATRFVRRIPESRQIELSGDDVASALTYSVQIAEIRPEHSGTSSYKFVHQGNRRFISNRKIALNWRSPRHNDHAGQPSSRAGIQVLCPAESWIGYASGKS